MIEIPPIPERLVDAIIFLRGEEDGRAWLAALPGRITYYARRWGLIPEAIAEGGAMSCCVFCTFGEDEAVLKIPVDPASGRREIRLLEHWSESGAAPAVLRSATSSGVFLMSRIRPGMTAWAVDADADSRRFGELLTRLNVTSANSVRTKDLAEVTEMRLDWARERFADPRYVNDVASVPDAELVLDVLLRTTRARHLLHADLQAKNVLRGPGGRWFAIDPLGAVGDVNAEAALWVAIQDGPAAIVTRLAELADHPLLEPARLAAWTFVFAIAEYRPYLPRPAGRIAEFLTGTSAEEVLERLGA